MKPRPRPFRSQRGVLAVVVLIVLAIGVLALYFATGGPSVGKSTKLVGAGKKSALLTHVNAIEVGFSDTRLAGVRPTQIRLYPSGPEDLRAVFEPTRGFKAVVPEASFYEVGRANMSLPEYSQYQLRRVQYRGEDAGCCVSYLVVFVPYVDKELCGTERIGSETRTKLQGTLTEAVEAYLVDGVYGPSGASVRGSSAPWVNGGLAGERAGTSLMQSGCYAFEDELAYVHPLYRGTLLGRFN